MAEFTLGKLAEAVGGVVQPESAATTPIRGINTLGEAEPGQVSVCGDKSYFAALSSTRAAAAFVPRKLTGAIATTLQALALPLVVVDELDPAINRVLQLFAPPIPRPPVGVDAFARVDATAELADGCRVGPFVTVGARAKLGARCVLHPGVVVGADTVLGDDCELFANVVVRERCLLGKRVVIHAGSVVGSDGFGYRWDGRSHAKVPQIGTVVIGDDVEIGSCACVDRAKYSRTVIGAGTKIDNLVQIAHNVRIGAHCIITGQVGLAGSVEVGNGVVFGGQSAVRDHIKLGDGAMVAACSAVAEDVDANAVVSGLPALPHRQSLREQGALRRLPELVTQMRKLQEEVNRLKAAAGVEPGDDHD